MLNGPCGDDVVVGLARVFRHRPKAIHVFYALLPKKQLLARAFACLFFVFLAKCFILNLNCLVIDLPPVLK